MLRIRQEQMEVFAQVGLRQFEQEAVEHIREIWQEEYSQLGEAGIRAFVKAGIERAQEHGFQMKYDVGRYLDLMLAFGDDFDRSFWAESILSEESLPPWLKMEELWEQAVLLLDDDNESD
ncbi:hypothetical protein Lepto7375DRAFT_1407 [Leptolyngbya sp. PCC 7375]|nr:hypothetical protein Lepto7375DRAFT_1407 [Leptolyngbya sp. PCC 7375]